MLINKGFQRCKIDEKRSKKNAKNTIYMSRQYK